MLVHGGYVSLHDGELRTALWTAHQLTGEDVLGGACEIRVTCFRHDLRPYQYAHSLPPHHGTSLLNG